MKICFTLQRKNHDGSSAFQEPCEGHLCQLCGLQHGHAAGDGSGAEGWAAHSVQGAATDCSVHAEWLFGSSWHVSAFLQFAPFFIFLDDILQFL